MDTSRPWHIVPTEDVKDHEENTSCWCDSEIRINQEGTMFVVHRDYWERLADHGEYLRQSRDAA